jgi:hypothetical protein
VELGHEVNFVSGTNTFDCHAIMYRFDERYGFQIDGCDSWIIASMPELVHVMEGRPSWYTGLWRSETDKLFVTAATGRVLINPDPMPGTKWETVELPGTLEGVWGLDDENVYVWGRRGDNPLLFHYDGKSWSEIACPGHVISMHGIAKDLILAVGDRGLTARWNGTTWELLPAFTKSVLSCVFVAGEDDICACGLSNEVFQGSARGLDKLMEHPHLTGCIAKWKDQWWVGVGGELGLSVLDGNTLISKKPNIIPTSFDARDSLLMAASVGLVGTPDGEVFTGRMMPDFARVAAKTGPPMWI